MTTVVAIDNHRIPKQIVTDEINTNEDLAIPYSLKKQTLPTYEKKALDKIV